MARIRLLLFALLSLLLSAAMGCGSTEPLDDDDASQGPTPEPTGTYDVEAFDDYFRITQMAIADSATGCGDTACSPELQALLDFINQTIYDQVELEVCGTDPCTTGEAAIMKQVGNLLDAILNVETLSKALNTPIQSGTANLLGEIKELKVGGDDYTLTLCTGTFKNTGWSVGACTSPDPGTMDPEGNLTFGPTTIPLTLTVTDSQGNVIFSYTFVLDIISVYIPAFNATTLTDVLIVGALSEEDIIGLVNQVLDSVNTVLTAAGMLPIDKEAIDAQIEAGLAPYMDLDTDEGPAMEIDLLAQWETIDIVQ